MTDYTDASTVVVVGQNTSVQVSDADHEIRDKSISTPDFMAGSVPLSALAPSLRDSKAISANKLMRFHAALANVANAPVDIVCVGDSVTEGGNATVAANRWVWKMRDAIRSQYQPAGVTGGLGYVPVKFQHGTIGNLFTYTGTINNQINNSGLGGRNSLLPTAATATIAFTGTGIRVIYAKQTSAASFKVAVDGGSETTISAQQGSPSLTDGFVWDSGALSAGAHSLVITGVSGTCKIGGVFITNGDEASGIRVWEAGRSGATSGSALTDSFSRSWFVEFNTVVQADLVTICFGLNDWNLDIPPDQYKANILEQIGLIRTNSAVAPSIVLIAPYQRNGVSKPTPWSQYVDQLYAIADADPDICVFDVSARVGTTAESYGIIDSSDHLHLSPVVGGQYWANALTRFILP